MNRGVFVFCILGCVCLSAWAWDVEHDEVAQLTGEFLPAEIRAQFDFDDFDVLMSYCHFPDMTEWEPRRFRNLDDIERIVGPEDRAIIASRGFHAYWMHTEIGKATFMSLMARAFGRGDHRRAAFYLSVLTHPIGDESALNHPTILNFVQYCRYEGVSFGTKKVEDGAKNIFGFRSDGGVMRRVREKMKGYRPRAPGGGFRAQQVALCALAVRQSAYAAEKEVDIAFGRGVDSADALADLVAMQVRAIVDVAWTCWLNRSPEAPLPFDDFQERFDTAADEVLATIDPGRQAVFADIFDAALNPPNPKGTVAVVCEALGLRSVGAQSYVGRLVLGACGRTLRDRGYAIEGCDFRALRDGRLDACRTPLLLVAAGNKPPAEGAAHALIAYRRSGGKIIYISGQDPVSLRGKEAGGLPVTIGNGDPENISGLAGRLVDRRAEELPVSPGWAKEGACPDWRKMALEIGGVRHPLRRDANGDGWAKPVCVQEIRVGEGVEPVAYLDNGESRFCVAARKDNVTWLPVYILSPFLFSEDNALDFGALRLDSFAEKVLLSEVYKLCGDRPRESPVKRPFEH